VFTGSTQWVLIYSRLHFTFIGLIFIVLYYHLPIYTYVSEVNFSLQISLLEFWMALSLPLCELHMLLDSLWFNWPNNIQWKTQIMKFGYHGAKVTERVELHRFSPSAPLWPVLGWTLHLPLVIMNSITQ